jgi:RNA polymerase sigma factor (sigma-70 family)
MSIAQIEATDEELLKSFVDQQQDAAFAELVTRHGSMVLGVCRRLVQDEHTAQEAFQATFLVLARKAASLRPPYALSSWLYNVAYRVAIRAKGGIARLRGHELSMEEVPDMPTSELNPAEASLWLDLKPVLDEELQRLAEKYRSPLVLCYLEGKTNEEAAGILGWPMGSMSRRLTKAKELLRERLVKRGLVFSSGTLFALLTEKSGAVMLPTELLTTTTQAANLFVAKQAAIGAISTKVAALTEATIKTMLIEKVKIVGLGFILTIGVGATAGSALYLSNISSSERVTEKADIGKQIAKQPDQAESKIPSTTAFQSKSKASVKFNSKHSPRASASKITKTSTPTQEALSSHSVLQEKLSTIIIKEISFNKTPLITALEEIVRLSQEADPWHQGISIVLEGDSELNGGSVTLSLKNIPLRTVLKYLISVTELHCRIENEELVIGKDEVEGGDLQETPAERAQLEKGWEASREAISKKLESTFIPRVVLDRVSAQAAVNYLMGESRNLDPEKKGENFILGVEDQKNLPTVTLNLNNISLMDLTKEICSATGLQYRIEPEAVVIDGESLKSGPISPDSIGGGGFASPNSKSDFVSPNPE